MRLSRARGVPREDTGGARPSTRSSGLGGSGSDRAARAWPARRGDSVQPHHRPRARPGGVECHSKACTGHRPTGGRRHV